MPVILKPRHYQLWMDPRVQQPRTAPASAESYPSEMVALAVSKVNSPMITLQELVKKLFKRQQVIC